ncbi:CsiV family protein [Marinomonas sp. IMCC 4694]|uniref:CsiV family protein n=1 Tax=Marinomonas sp. IMCC 4694 TaxID=2605432 RepID=UPI0011E89DB4|nr:CsiV family protein [Marinomonas sp. IMCC 4694]TYL47494.1 hypothetical protein FXV75_05765 [Marinomonas sp. IMCC 4694]
MKALIVTALTLTLLSTSLFAEDSDFNPETARAYEGFLVTFLWPEGQSEEHIDYENVLSVQNLLRLDIIDTSDGSPLSLTQPKLQESTLDKTRELAPFADIKQKLNRHVTVLSNQRWTLIFKQTGDTVRKTFHSEQIKDGYPELTGTIAITLGRYLESDIRYQHYLFDSFTVPEQLEVADSSLDLQPVDQEAILRSIFTQPTTASEPENALTKPIAPQTQFKEFEPALVLTLNQSNKTASKKVNYLDHPTIGTMLYFEPIELNDAIEKIAAKTVAE